MGSRELEAAIQKTGNPAVVIAAIRAPGFCTFSDWRLVPTMLELALKASGQIDVPVGAWDVRTTQPFPPGWIEGVLPPDHAKLGDGPRP